jgi:hypothetical protein
MACGVDDGDTQAGATAFTSGEGGSVSGAGVAQFHGHRRECLCYLRIARATGGADEGVGEG